MADKYVTRAELAHSVNEDVDMAWAGPGAHSISEEPLMYPAVKGELLEQWLQSNGYRAEVPDDGFPLTSSIPTTP